MYRSSHVIVGETGNPFDLKNAEMDSKISNAALDRTIQGMEANLLEYVLWNYMPYNTASQGDWWNGEDLSIRNEGRNRGIDAVARPYVYSIEGNAKIISQGFEMVKGIYSLEVETDCYAIRNDEEKEEAVSSSAFEIFVPQCHFPITLMSITPRSGNADIEYDGERQSIMWSVYECNDGLAIT